MRPSCRRGRSLHRADTVHSRRLTTIYPSYPRRDRHVSTPTAYQHEPRTDSGTIDHALEDAKPIPFWLDTPERPEARPPLRGDSATDLLVVGGGYCGLWTALLAKERDPARRVILVDKERIAGAASGRNGGFCEASVTHGEDNGRLHFANELDTIDRLAAASFAGIAEAIERYGIDAEYESTGMLTVATEPHQIGDLRAAADDIDKTFLEGDRLRAYGTSPLYRAGLFTSEGIALVHPAKLAWGLARAAQELGVEIYENTEITKLTTTASEVRAHTKRGTIRASRIALATNGFRSPLARLRLFTVPIYDYVIVSEPLTDAQLQMIGWTKRYGIADSSREFHYHRKTADNRILFGGYDAVYHRGRKVLPEQDQREETFRRLADHFFLTYPDLHGITFTHKWGGMIDMSTQLSAFHGTAKGGRIAYSAGYTGLGVGATRFGAEVMLDFLEGKRTERTELKMSRRLPIPIPPEPIAYPLIQTVRRAVARSDADGGKDGMLLRAAALLGIGFDS